MGQILKQDKIGTLSHSSGIISLTASTITIGGQQYVTSTLSRTISDDVTMTANSLYMIFAVVSGGVPVLRISSNFNSVGPAGFTSWKLVGAFYANGGPPTLSSTAATTIAFGSFVTIDGVPESNWIADNLIIGGTGSAPAKATNRVNDESRWMRRGSKIHRYWTYHHNSNVGATAGSGTYLFPLPSGFVLDTSQWSAGADINGRCLAGAGMTDSGNSYNAATAKFYDSTNLIITADQESVSNEVAVGSTFAPMTQAAQSLGYVIHDIPIVGLTNTPIKDL